jgi:hypothetical protein
MVTFMEDSAAWLGGYLKQAAGHTLNVMRQGAPLAVAIVGTLSLRDYEIVDEEGILTLFTATDWTFTAADMGSWVPRSGDLLFDGTKQYEVLPIAHNPCYEPLDAAGVLQLVHSKEQL